MRFVTVTTSRIPELSSAIEPFDRAAAMAVELVLQQELHERSLSGERYTIETNSFKKKWDREK